MNDLLVQLAVGGLLGILGQGLRTVAGLKSMSDDARAQNIAPLDLFQANRLFVSLFLGFVTGMAAILTIPLNATNDIKSLLPIILAGYAGVDFIEAFISQYITPARNDASSLAGVRANVYAETTSLRLKPVTGRSLVYAILGIPAGADPKVQDARSLADFAYDTDGSKQTLTSDVNDHLLACGVARANLVPPAKIIACDTVGSLVAVVSAALQK